MPDDGLVFLEIGQYISRSTISSFQKVGIPILPNKQSISRTLHHQTLRYLSMYEVKPKDIRRKKDLANLVDSIFFFWIKESSENDYQWSQSCTSLLFLGEHSDEIKRIIHQKILEQISPDRISNA